ncbi:LmbE family protein [Caldalkalibacillus thermarum TA2.A1]|uniref:LmbE family protein n=1 Tax=Caldalkalibacillus thermarum (strain TA2.A1) TaxID=986075 RepID=F5LBB6_CALTT|nr:PIG-L family deacetylase [Caldalkalibacillus thermarum]EGL81366.1 LmbE family protein [Caldalkalibacillus thermarum TA2.A1]QZT33350.1 PIG-L family deacetylase [Caldalkalibacillus thermarum TA2.A1]
MNILYIFPHPDDESFGPAAVMHQQIKAGHRVYLLTLTLKHTEHDLIDCIVLLSQEDMDMLVKCLSCYETY